MNCSNCGAPLDSDAAACVESREQHADDLVETAGPLKWLAIMPSWLRWIIALPGGSFVGAMVVRRIELAGLNDHSIGIIYPSAIALTMYGTAYLAAVTAPSDQRQVGLATIYAQLAAYCISLLLSALVGVQVVPFSGMHLTLNLIMPAIGTAGAVLSIARNTSRINNRLITTNLVSTDAGFRLWLGISVAVSLAAGFEIIGLGVSALWPTYLPFQSENSIVVLIASGIIVRLIAEYAPARNMLAA